jgi:arginase
MVDLIGVCFDGSGRPGGQSLAPAVLREAGLVGALPDSTRLLPDVMLSEASSTRGPLAGFLNEAALLEMAEAVRERVASTLREGRFPLIYGADCAVLLGSVPALVEVEGSAGLVFIDGHEDATSMQLTESGEVANMEVALLLGRTGERAPAALRSHLPALSTGALVMMGQRDERYRSGLGVPSVADGVVLRTVEELHRDPARAGREAAEHVRREAGAWWLHIDLDVLVGTEFWACDAANDPAMTGGLTWAELTTITSAALRAGGCSGWDVVVYNPDLDPDREMARRIVRFVSEVVEGADFATSSDADHI